MLRGLHANAQPGVLYAIYLDLPANATPAQSADHLVGTINFFDAVAHPGHESASVDKTRFISFDATEVVRALREKKLLTATPAVTIVPIGRPAADAKPVVERDSRWSKRVKKSPIASGPHWPGIARRSFAK